MKWGISFWAKDIM